jgi:hypothetical protein
MNNKRFISAKLKIFMLNTGGSQKLYKKMAGFAVVLIRTPAKEFYTVANAAPPNKKFPRRKS